MIPYSKIVYIRSEIKDEHSKINKLVNDKTKEFKKSIEEDDEFKNFCKEYSNLFNKIIDDNYKKTLQKLIPIIVKIHKDNNKKSNLNIQHTLL